MNRRAKLLLTIWVLALVPSASIVACIPDCGPCDYWNGYYCDPVCGECCDCMWDEYYTYCIDNDLYCRFFCSNCECMLGCRVDSVTASPSSVCMGQSVTCQADGYGFSLHDVVWEASAGSFPNGNTGTSVTWQAPSTAGYVTISAYCWNWGSSTTVAVVDVGSIVEAETMSTGPIYPGCPHGFPGPQVMLIAVPEPAGASWPSGEPHWTLQKVTGSSAYLVFSSGYNFTALEGTDKWGDYRVSAACGNGGGASITVHLGLQSEDVYRPYDPTSGTWPESCYNWPCSGHNSYQVDGCGNIVEFSCATESGNGSWTGGCAYRVFYNGKLISSCIFSNDPTNEVSVRIATVDGTGQTYITKVLHANISNQKGEVLDGYYATKFVELDVQTGICTTTWRISTQYQPTAINRGDPWEGPDSGPKSGSTACL